MCTKAAKCHYFGIFLVFSYDGIRVSLIYMFSTFTKTSGLLLILPWLAYLYNSIVMKQKTQLSESLKWLSLKWLWITINFFLRLNIDEIKQVFSLALYCRVILAAIHEHENIIADHATVHYFLFSSVYQWVSWMSKRIYDDFSF